MQQPRSALSGMTFPALPDAPASTALALQFQLERSQWLSPDALLQLQMKQLHGVLKHAATTVPYYRDLFAAHGLTVPDSADYAFLQRVPPSRRAALRNAGTALQSQNIPAEHGPVHPVVTSGSTGEPVRLLGNVLTRLCWHAFALRDHLWQARDFSHRLGIIRWAPKDKYAAPDGMHWATWGSIVGSTFDSGPSFALNVATPLREQIEWLLRMRPDILLSYPSNLDCLARHCLDRGIDALRFTEVRTIGETISTDQRALYARAWSCKVVDVYTCEETGYLALQCAEKGSYHVQSENVLLEIVDDNDQPCPPGVVGRVLITALHNFATPLLRYELGDYAAFGEACACGRGLPVITRIHGRKRNRIVYPDGRAEFPYLGEHGQIHALTGVRISAFQIVQRSVEDIEIRLVGERQFTADETAKVVQKFQRNFGHPFRISITFWDEIPKGSRGKFEEFVSEVAL